MDIHLGDGSTIPVAVESRRDDFGLLSLTADVFSARQSTTVPVGEVIIGPDGATGIEIPIFELGLVSEALDFSGILTLRGHVAYEDGLEVGVQDLVLFFHPEDLGWRVYDRQARDAAHDGGALTSGAREVRDRAISTLPPPEDPDAALTFGGVARGTKISDDPEHIPEITEER